MIKLTINENQSGQRLDRFLKKYFDAAPLSHIYKMIRKDVKLNGKRATKETMVQTGDTITVYIGEEEAASLQRRQARRPGQHRGKKQFAVTYEDETLLIVEKPFGLLTHGDSHEKKNHLTNQVIDYLIEKGEYDPRADRTFTPAPAGRLDRNTTGLVMFGKNGPALQALNRLLREKDGIGKFYLTIVAGTLQETLHLTDLMEKDEKKNQIAVLPLQEAAHDAASSTGKLMETIARPLLCARYSNRPYTLVEVQILTGRTHQIRAQLAHSGYPIIGDTKYGSPAVNRVVRQAFGLHTHLLHAWRLVFGDLAVDSPIGRLRGRQVEAALPADFARIKDEIFGKNKKDIGDK